MINGLPVDLKVRRCAGCGDELWIPDCRGFPTFSGGYRCVTRTEWQMIRNNAMQFEMEIDGRPYCKFCARQKNLSLSYQE